MAGSQSSSLLPGSSAFGFFSIVRVAYPACFLGLAGMGVPVLIAVADSGLNRSVLLGVDYAGIVVASLGLVMTVAFSILGLRRLGAERRSGYTTMPSPWLKVDLVDRHTGAVIRPADIPPAGGGVFVFSLRREIRLAKDRREGSSR